MKFIILFFCCACLSFSASAQWSIFQKHERLPELPNARSIAFKMPKRRSSAPPKIYATPVARGDYDLELAENEVMKLAQHNMRFRLYNTASRNFYELAQLYIQQNRLSEAKWFFLQSTIISRENNNDKLTIANLLQLAGIKAAIGDFVLAQQDLLEARDIASTRGYLTDLLLTEKQLSAIQRNRFVSVKTDLRYDDNLQKIAAAN